MRLLPNSFNKNLTRRSDEMQKLINPCINGVIELIESQINKVGSEKARRVKVSALRARKLVALN